MGSKLWIRHGQEPPDEATVLLHFGAGDPKSVIQQVLRTYGDYRDVSTPQKPEGCGLFAVSLYAITDEVTQDQIYAEMPHRKVGQATFGQVRELVPVLATSCTWDGMSKEMAHLQASHYDAVLPHPTHFVDMLRSTDPSELDEDPLEQLRDALRPRLSGLLALFEPRLAK